MMKDDFIIGVVVPILAMLGFLVVFVVAFVIYTTNRQRKKENETVFSAKLSTAINKGVVKSIDTAINFYKGYFERTDLRILDYYNISLYLDKISFQVASDSSKDAAETERILVLITALLAENQKLLNEQQAKLPFSGTPQPERGLLEDILELTSGDKVIVHSKLDELAKFITTRQVTIDKLSEDNKKSANWTRWGAIGTVLFGILSIILTLK